VHTCSPTRRRHRHDAALDEKRRTPRRGHDLDIARESGVKLYPCSTTMGVMGVEPGHLVDGVTIAVAAAFLDFAAEADVSMFV
jgi:predicted peroxiredoxin